MDGLSAGASGIAVVSIAIQLAESIKKLSDFVGSIQEAPKDIGSILSELRMLSGTLDDIRLHSSVYNANSNTEFVLENLERKITAFLNLANQYKPGLDSKSRRIRKWNALKVAFKSDKFKKIRESLNETKITLILARQNSQQNNDSKLSYQRQDLPIINEDEFVFKRNQSSRTVVTTSTQATSLHDDHIKDLKKEIRRMASSMRNPIQRSIFISEMHQFLQDSIPDLYIEHDEPALKADAKLEPGIEIEAIAKDRDHKRYPQDHESLSELSFDKNSSQRLFCERPKIITSTTNTLLGKIYLKFVVYEDCRVNPPTKTNVPHQVTSRYESFFTLHPADWLIWLGMKSSLDVMISRSTSGWKNTFKAFRAVPVNSLIFEFCATGNLDGVRSLLTRGDASVWDRDPDGYTPLHAAMFDGQYELCKLLINYGAERNVPVFENEWSPAFYYTFSTNRKNFTDMSLIRAFFEFFDFSENGKDRESSSYQSWLFLCFSTGLESDEMYNVIESDEGEKIYPKYESVFRSLIDVFGSDIMKTMDKLHILLIWQFSRSLLFLKWFITSTGSEAFTFHRDILIMYLLMSWNKHSHYDFISFDLTKDKIKFLREKGASLHWTTWGESLTTSAMKDAITFKLWCEILKELEIDFQSFIKEEIDKGILQQRGWNEEALMNLFRGSTMEKLNKNISKWDAIDYCPNCGSPKPTLWELYREAIKTGIFVPEVEDDNGVDSGESGDDREINLDRRDGDENKGVDYDSVRDAIGISESDEDNDDVKNDNGVSNDDASNEGEVGNNDEVCDGDGVHHDSDARASDEVSGDGEIPDDEVYKSRLCDSCRKALTFNLEHPIPGSFDPR